MITVPKVEVCIPVYNGSNFLEDALKSIQHQTFKDLRVFVSNNKSTDDTADIIERFSSIMPLRSINQPQTLYSTDHFNFVLDHVESEYYMVLCHDDYFFSPTALELAVQILDSDPEISAVYSDLVFVNAAGRVLMKRHFRQSGRTSGDEIGRRSVRSARNLFGIPILIRRAHRGHLRYDRNLDYVNDVDLSWMISKERPLFHINDPLIAYRLYSTNSTWDLIKKSEQAFLDMAEKHGMCLTERDRRRIRLVNWSVMQQKRVFGLYSRAVSRLS